MKRLNDLLIFSPSDLVKFLKSPYASWRDHLKCDGLNKEEQDSQSPEAELIIRLGNQHERRVLAQLTEEGGLWNGDDPKAGGFEISQVATIEALRAGHRLLFQAALGTTTLQGWADFLFRTEEPSKLGAHSYEVVDTKLARTPTPAFLVQLCAYADLLEQIQGTRCKRLGVITGDGERHWFRTNDYFYYYLALKEDFLQLHHTFSPDRPPEIDPSADHGRWQSHADRALESVDDLSLIAGMARSQRKKLRDLGVVTMTDFANGEHKPKGVQPHVLDRLRTQARLQLESKPNTAPKFEVIPSDDRRGLGLLPPPSPNDVYFDLEGYPFEEGGLEYLFGVTSQGKFDASWAHDRTQEKAIFEAFIDRVMTAWRADPRMHVYHYGDYERAAVQRLMGRYGTREQEVDDLFRNEVFVNLYRVVQQGLRIGVPSYSLKYIERLYRGGRDDDVKTATQSVVEYANYLELRDADPEPAKRLLEGICRYNQADCDSTAELASWLQTIQAQYGLDWVPPPPPKPKEEPTKPPQQAELFAGQMLAKPPRWALESPGLAEMHALLAQLLTFHQREHRPFWWSYFDRRDRPDEELTDDHDCLGGLVRTEAPGAKLKSSLVYEYRFNPDQETKIEEGKKAYLARTNLKKVEVIELDADGGRITLKFTKENLPAPERCSLIPIEIVAPGTIVESLLATAKIWQERGELPNAVRALLLRSPPTFTNAEPGVEILPTGRDSVEVLTDRVLHLDHSVLAIQGPPGTGKTYTAAEIIVGLMRANKRVGIASNSHDAINKLLGDSIAAAAREGVPFRAIKMGREANGSAAEYIETTTDLDTANAPGPILVAGTAWVFSHKNLRDFFDVLFIDEAGQVCLANAAGMAPAAKSLVLLGDQMQLDQPTKGTHPGDSGQSVLQYLLKGHATVPPTLGAFLPETRRLHPDLCHLLSDAIYEGRLKSRPGNERRVLRARTKDGPMARESGLVFVAVEHEGNTRECGEEVDAVRALIDGLLGRERTDDEGNALAVVGPSDILIVAPYNAQVRRLKAALPGVRIGTVDRFQGQEAQVVIISMTTSGGETPTRGIEFLFSVNRLNVAISRAQSLTFIVADPRHAESRISNLLSITLLNLFSRTVLGSRDRRLE